LLEEFAVIVVGAYPEPNYHVIFLQVYLPPDR
jgi:hypothetical protein